MVAIEWLSQLIGSGILSLVPPLLAIALAIATRRPMLALFLGIWSGAIIHTGGHGIAQTFDWIVAAIIVDDGFHVQILVFTLLLGSGVALIWRLGGAIAVRNWATNRLETQQTVGLTTWGLGIAMFFDDYANTAIVGSTMREISDQLRISREKLAYIVDSTAAPVATLGISSWVAFQLSLIGSAYEEMGVAGEAPTAFATFVRSIPYNTYALLAIVMVGIVVYTGRDYGEMLDAEHRARTTGAVNREGAQPLQKVEEDLGKPIDERPMLRTFFAPVVVLVAVTLAGAFWTGYQSWQSSQAEAGAPTAFGAAVNDAGFTQVLIDVVGAGSFATALIWGSFAMVVTAIAIGLAYGLFDIGEGVETVIDGFGIMLTAVTILVLAWTISSVAETLGTGEYVATVAEPYLSEALLPVLILFVAAFVAFTMGSSWATMGLVTPIAVRVAYEFGSGFELVPVAVGAVFSGAIFGDHASPISDTTVLSATFSGADLIDHVRTQLPYALTVFLVVVGCYLLNGYLGVPPIVFLPLGVAALVGLVVGLSELDAGRKGLEPVATEPVVSGPEPEGEIDADSTGGDE
ncbi:Na+/H+ antiporter NhaC family protein [Natrinema thermotolerans]|uniref:Na+/H+ antiporter NhaC family protein n=1 Tax=Natrinema thermotolerans TaxID=121872 RepID=A0AAF0P803_9EURY|nr:Na+/H+ antiporter NhaC family protein [Natrinema thermotolerans]QCC60052.1 Na+/H+ antiporter NhaC family protein [Natrinema thermotolerans]QCC60976.1 Na+/H+ antiporter NhaC family protein [Natrinema thermotolerans]WMT07058.1 Na+/H+ antiporter NhaC family protein [Natrinema thermotolerans]